MGDRHERINSGQDVAARLVTRSGGWRPSGFWRWRLSGMRTRRLAVEVAFGGGSAGHGPTLGVATAYPQELLYKVLGQLADTRSGQWSMTEQHPHHDRAEETLRGPLDVPLGRCRDRPGSTRLRSSSSWSHSPTVRTASTSSCWVRAIAARSTADVSGRESQVTRLRRWTTRRSVLDGRGSGAAREIVPMPRPMRRWRRSSAASARTAPGSPHRRCRVARAIPDRSPDHSWSPCRRADRQAEPAAPTPLSSGHGRSCRPV